MLNVVILNVVILNVVILNVVILNVVILNVITLNVILLNVIMLNVITLNVILLNVITLIVILLNLFLLNVVILSVIVLSVMAPHQQWVLSCIISECTMTKKSFQPETLEKSHFKSHFLFFGIEMFFPDILFYLTSYFMTYLPSKSPPSLSHFSKASPHSKRGKN